MSKHNPYPKQKSKSHFMTFWNWLMWDWWHRLRCPECREMRSVNAVIARGVEQIQAESAPAKGLMETLKALGLVSMLNHPHSKPSGTLNN